MPQAASQGLWPGERDCVHVWGAVHVGGQPCTSVCVHGVVYVCLHAPVRHLYSVSQSPVPPRVWTVRHGHCGQHVGQPRGPCRPGPGFQSQPALGSARSLNRHCACSSPRQPGGVGAKGQCCSVLQGPHWRRGILGYGPYVPAWIWRGWWPSFPLGRHVASSR